VPTSQTDPGYDIAVVGAGPAGLAAATSAANSGARVALIDSGARVGGQYWRHRRGDDIRHQHRWKEFRRLRGNLDHRRALIDYLPEHFVWHVERTGSGFSTHATCGDAERVVDSRAVVVATGAYDRQLPFPGWTLPGVFTAGAVQGLLKGQGVLAGRRVGVAGTGPFLLAVAAGLAEAGATVVGVFEAGLPTGFARHPLAVLANPGKVAEGAGYLRILARHRVPCHPRTGVIAAHASPSGDSVHGVTVARLDRDWRPVPGTDRRIDCDTVAVGYGFVPQIEIPLQLGCDTRLDVDDSLVAVVDDRQRSTVPGVFIAGEACGVGGAVLSVLEGELAGLHAAHLTGAGVPDPARVRRLARRRAAQRSFATAMHQAFPVAAGWSSWLDDDTVICRCEEVPASAVTRAVDQLGATDPRAVKLFARPGMGLCQGRMCGFATAGLVADRLGRTVTAEDLRGMSSRPIAQPITLGTLAAGPRGGRVS